MALLLFELLEPRDLRGVPRPVSASPAGRHRGEVSIGSGSDLGRIHPAEAVALQPPEAAPTATVVSLPELAVRVVLSSPPASYWPLLLQKLLLTLRLALPAAGLTETWTGRSPPPMLPQLLVADRMLAMVLAAGLLLMTPRLCCGPLLRTGRICQQLGPTAPGPRRWPAGAPPSWRGTALHD